MCYMNVSRSFLYTNDIYRSIFVKSVQSYPRIVCGKIHIYRSDMTVVSSSIHADGECFLKNDMARLGQFVTG